MCGIVGIIDPYNGFVNKKIKKMTDSISHRGPDAEGFLFANNKDILYSDKFKVLRKNYLYALGHRRLSIIDIKTGAQPQCNEDQKIWITFNGEIYNHFELRKTLKELGHLFRTDHSDTEVIIHAYEEWGIKAFNKFNGIFCFGILDLHKNKLILARDHFGVKPVYYYNKNRTLIFSSEIKAILQCKDVERLIDIEALNDYLDYRYVPSPKTLFKDIKKIEAGGYLEVDIKECKIIGIGNYTSHKTIIDYKKNESNG